MLRREKEKKAKEIGRVRVVALSHFLTSMLNLSMSYRCFGMFLAGCRAATRPSSSYIFYLALLFFQTSDHLMP